MIRNKPHYRADAFLDGLRACGFEPTRSDSGQHDLRPGDLLVTWNLYGRYQQAYDRARKAGVDTVVAENGYVGKDSVGRQFYALGLNGHNGYGAWFPRADASRFNALGVKLLPFVDRPDGYVLICDQRGIGHPDWRSPRNFVEIARAALKQAGERRVHVRYHPGRHQPQRPLEDDLAGARAVLVWSSNVANIALTQGVPAVRMGPYHVNRAVRRWDGKGPFPEERPDRFPAFVDLAWAQWSVDEIGVGLPFKHLLGKKVQSVAPYRRDDGETAAHLFLPAS